MKPQDIVFFAILLVLIFIRKSNLFVIVGLAAILIAIPLFAKHIFFTAEHLIYYAGGFFLTAIIFKLYENWN